MSLRAAAFGFWWRHCTRRVSNLGIHEEFASGKEQKRPRNDIVELEVDVDSVQWAESSLGAVRSVFFNKW